MTRRTTPDPAEALADHLLTDAWGKKVRRASVIRCDGVEIGNYNRAELVGAIRKFYPPQKPKRVKRAK